MRPAIEARIFSTHPRRCFDAHSPAVDGHPEVFRRQSLYGIAAIVEHACVHDHARHVEAIAESRRLLRIVCDAA
jgi:hypothetical protein